MWTIRFLTGSLKGQTPPLQNGTYIIGRGEDCQITVKDEGISKKHAKLKIDENDIFIYDLESSNGTFLNGIQIQESEIKPSDKISLYNTTFDLVQSSLPVVSVNPNNDYLPPNMPQNQVPQQYENSNTYLQQTGQLQQPGQTGQQGYTQQLGQQNPQNNTDSVANLTLKNKCINYLDQVVLPGIYKLPEWIEFRWVIASFLLFFVAMVTILSSIPLIRILNTSVAQESMNHAESIATTLANSNKEPIKAGLYTATSVEYAIRRPGVIKAFIIKASNGQIITPSSKANTYIKLPFANEGRTKDTKSIKQLNSDTVAAMVPIQFYNHKTGLNSSVAYSVVLYNTGALNFGNKRTLSLLIQTGFIATVLGLIIFFFLYKLIEYPIVSINKQLHLALTDNSLSIQTKYNFPVLTELITNINATLSRIFAAQEKTEQNFEYDRLNEMNHLIEIIGYPTLGINMENMKIESISPHFEDEVGISIQRIINSNIQDIEDQALKLNLTNLLDRVQQHSQEIATDSLEFSGVEFNLSAKGVFGKSSLAYVLISFMPKQEEETPEG